MVDLQPSWEFMNRPQDNLYGAQASRDIDAHAIAALTPAGVDGFALMQRAAQAAFNCLLRHFPDAGSVSVLCGKGNNAGDAYLVAQCAHAIGIKVQLLAVVAPQSLQGDALRAYQQAQAAGVEVLAYDAQPLSGDVVVDGLLGTGLNGAPRAPFDEAIQHVNEAGKPVLSIDIPSGVSADTGAVFDQAVRASVTMSFITRKVGLYTGAGVSYAGEREYDDLGVASEFYCADAIPRLYWQPDMLTQLDPNTYKHRQGHVVVAGGDLNMPGAVVLATSGVLRVGAGMVTALTHGEHVSTIVGYTPEVMVQAFSQETPEQAEEATRIADLLQRADVVVLGPGLGRTAWSQTLYQLAEAANKPTVLDADGLYWLARNGVWRGGPLTITPHIAEAARLLQLEAAAVQANRLGCARQLAQQFGAQGVLKGAGSVVFDATGERLCICAHGNPGMASAGMGDVLSGIVGGLLAQVSPGQDVFAGLAAGVALHSAAGDEAAQKVGQRSLIASDLLSVLPRLVAPSAT